MKTDNCDGCHLGLQSYEMMHQINFSNFQKTAKVVHKYDYFKNPQSIIDVLKGYKTGSTVILLLFYSSKNITPILKMAAIMIYLL